MRNFIDLMTEFVSEFDRDHGGGNNGMILIHNIVWDVDPSEAEELKLPKRATTSMEAVEEAADPYADPEDRDNLMYKIGDWLTSTYDCRLSDFDYTVM